MDHDHICQVAQPKEEKKEHQPWNQKHWDTVLALI